MESTNRWIRAGMFSDLRVLRALGENPKVWFVCRVTAVADERLPFKGNIRTPGELPRLYRRVFGETAHRQLILNPMSSAVEMFKPHEPSAVRVAQLPVCRRVNWEH